MPGRWRATPRASEDEDDRVRPGHLIGRQQGERLLQGRDRLGLPAAVPQGVRAAVEHERAPDRVSLGREHGQGLVEQGHRAVEGARLVGGLAGQVGHLGLVQAGALLRVGHPGPDLSARSRWRWASAGANEVSACQSYPESGDRFR